MKICIVSPLCYPILAGLTNIESAGGSQTQVILIAKELAAQGWLISFLVGDYGQDSDFEVIDKFEVYKVFSVFKKPKIFQFVKNYIHLKRILQKIKPEICFTRGETGYLWPIINVCKRTNIKTVYSTAHVTDCMYNHFIDNRSNIGRKLYESSIPKVDNIITQSKDQQKLLRDSFNKESNVIYNCRYDLASSINSNKSDLFLWVGSIRKRKQPEVFIELAIRLPHLKFVMIGGSYEKERPYVKKIINMTNNISNLDYKGFVRDDFQKSFYSNVIAVINTSKNEGEGFPNTFIESWSYGKPVVSLFVNPDNIINKHELGYVSGSFEKLVEDVKKINEPSQFLRLGHNAKKYFLAGHDIKNIIYKYEEVFNKLISY